MASLTVAQASLLGAVYIDENPGFTVTTLPDRLPDEAAVSICGLPNLLNCPIGARGRIFEPEFGSMWYQFLQEPLDDITAASMRIAMIQSIQRWEPRIKLDMNNTFVQPDYNLPGYRVRIAYFYVITGKPASADFTVKVKQQQPQ
ncbi:baseplate assembly chaperone [Burkholderia phage BCSR5]|nr:baseplate assembly chaperone [Burkholderia phage BCSR5]